MFLFAASLRKRRPLLLLLLLCVCAALQMCATQLKKRNSAVMAVDLQGMRIFTSFGLTRLQFVDQISNEFIRVRDAGTAQS